MVLKRRRPARHKRVYPHDRGPRRQADPRLTTGDRMTSNPDTSLTIDTHHHILPDFFWRETNEACTWETLLWSRSSKNSAHHVTVEGNKRGLMLASLRYLYTFAKLYGS